MKSWSVTIQMKVTESFPVPLNSWLETYFSFAFGCSWKIRVKWILFYILTGCDHSWLEYRGHCYKFFNEQKTWSSAREFCRALRGDLVVIQDKKTQKFVYEKLAVTKTLWIGLRRNNGYGTNYIFGRLVWTEIFLKRNFNESFKFKISLVTFRWFWFFWSEFW